MSAKRFNFGKHKLQQQSLLTFVNKNEQNCDKPTISTPPPEPKPDTTSKYVIDDDSLDFDTTFSPPVSQNVAAKPKLDFKATLSSEKFNFKSTKSSASTPSDVKSSMSSSPVTDGPSRPKFDFKATSSSLSSEKFNFKGTKSSTSTPSDVKSSTLSSPVIDGPSRPKFDIKAASSSLSSEKFNFKDSKNSTSISSDVKSSTSSSPVIESSPVTKNKFNFKKVKENLSSNESPPISSKPKVVQHVPFPEKLKQSVDALKQSKSVEDQAKSVDLSKYKLENRKPIRTSLSMLSKSLPRKNDTEKIIQKSKFFPEGIQLDSIQDISTVGVGVVDELEREYMLVLEKMVGILESIPMRVLESLKGFDGLTYRTLKFEKLKLINQIKRSKSETITSPKENHNTPETKPKSPIKEIIPPSPPKSTLPKSKTFDRILQAGNTLNSLSKLNDSLKTIDLNPKKPNEGVVPDPNKKTLLNLAQVTSNKSSSFKESSLSKLSTSSFTSNVTNDGVEYDFEEDYSRIDFELNEPKSQSVIEINSTAGSSNNVLGEDEDDWPEYRPEDFEDVIPSSQESGSSIRPVRKTNTTTVDLLSDEDLLPDEDWEKHLEIEEPSSKPEPLTANPMGDFQSNVQNDGITGAFDSLNYDHSFIMMEQFHEKFGLKAFRPNQLQVINAALLRHDTFVLMPTGGGKSLCYQLPAILTPGVTIVISPLKSLIMDQVNKLEALDIPATQISGNLSETQVNAIYMELSRKEPVYKLLYVTPEKLIASRAFQDVLKALYQRSKLSRFVIDEAHCVSQWGHDFRPDYKKLSVLRTEFPDVPIMALTATATPRVRSDILHQLNLKDCKWFLCSFNRPNLKYAVIPKTGKSVVNDIVALIKARYNKMSGIIYCLSRKDCDQVATDLNKQGIRAISYHAGLTDTKREEVQNAWIEDKVRIVCATIAFGMGIDKPDVRIVIHHSLPKSIEGYYQESGRAGRDGDPADCILYYNYGDMHRIRRMMDLEKNQNPSAHRQHMENLNRIVQYCENYTDCRRAQQLNYFGENFNRQLCLQTERTICDNCSNSKSYKIIDATAASKSLVKLVFDLCKVRNFTLIHIADVYKGSSIKKIVESSHDKHPLYAEGKSWEKNDILRLLHKLVMEEYLREEIIVAMDVPISYIKVGPRVDRLMQGGVKIEFPLKISGKSKPKESTQISAVNKSSTTSNEQLKAIKETCYEELQECCRKMAHAKNITVSAVMNMQALKAMADKLPESPAEMLQLPHVTKANFEKFGQELLEITMKHAIEKCRIVMELQQKQVRIVDDDDETDWSQVSSQAAKAASSAKRGVKRPAAANRSWGGTAKKFRRKVKRKSPKGKSRGGKSTRGTSRGTARGRSAGIGFMSIPTTRK